MRFTDAGIRALKATEKQTFYRDPAFKGFGIRVSPKGAKTFALMHGADRRLTSIGRYPIITLQQARDAAKRILASKTLGQYQPRSVAFSEALDTFIEKHCSTIRTGEEYTRMLKREILPKLQHKTLDRITPHDLTDIFDKLSPSVAEHCFTYARVFFNWSVGRCYLEHSPMRRMRPPGVASPRRPLVTDDQLKSIWLAADDQHGKIVRLIILTGSRRGEIGNLSWPNILSDRIYLPETKSGREHTIPLGPMAQSIIRSLPRLNSTPLLFPSEALTPFNAWSRHKLALDQASGVSNWTLHSLRRKFRTLHARLGTPRDIAERLIGHILASDVEQIYDMWDYFDPMRKATLKYETLISNLVAPQKAIAA